MSCCSVAAPLRVSRGFRSPKSPSPRSSSTTVVHSFLLLIILLFILFSLLIHLFSFFFNLVSCFFFCYIFLFFIFIILLFFLLWRNKVILNLIFINHNVYFFFIMDFLNLILKSLFAFPEFYLNIGALLNPILAIFQEYCQNGIQKCLDTYSSNWI